MTPEEKNPKAHHQTVRGARLALARRQVSQKSYRAVLAGEITLQQAKAIGRDGAPATDIGQSPSGPGTATEISPSASTGGTQDGADRPPQPLSRISKDDRTRSCLCGCRRETRGLFARGHDMAMYRVAREHLTEGRELSDEQREYLERSGKMERVKDKITQEKRKIGVKRGDAK